MSLIPVKQNHTNDTSQWHVVGWLISLFCAYLMLVGVAELLIAQIDPRLGLAIHVLLLIALTLHAGLGRDANARKLALAMIRTLRRRAGMTYVELAQRTQLSARVLAEIEHGLRLPSQAQLELIFQVLGAEAA